MSFLQGEALPNITTTQGQTTTAPSWYTDYLSNLASQGSTAASNANYVGAQPLQQQAFTNVAQNVGNYQPGLTAATNLAEAAGKGSALAAANPYLQTASQAAPDVVGNYMNPYTQNVVNEIGRLGQQNITQNLAPGATAGAVGSGQFGSRRGAQVLGNTIRDALANIGTNQTNALSQGYQNAIQAAQTDLSRIGGLGQTTGQLAGADLANKLNAAQQTGALAQQTQAQGLADVNALATLGAQQQQIGQNEQLFPLQTLNTASGLIRGYSIPTNVSSTYTGPIPGAYSPSTLQQIAGLGALVAGISDTTLGTSLANKIISNT